MNNWDAMLEKNRKNYYKLEEKKIIKTSNVNKLWKVIIFEDFSDGNKTEYFAMCDKNSDHAAVIENYYLNKNYYLNSIIDFSLTERNIQDLGGVIEVIGLCERPIRELEKGNKAYAFKLLLTYFTGIVKKFSNTGV